MPTETPPAHAEAARRDARPDSPADAASLDARLRAVERAVHGAAPGADTPVDDAAALAERLDAVEDRLADLDASIQALQGFVGDVEAVNESVERRANAALAAAERAPPPHPVPDLPESELETEPAQPAGSDDAGPLARLLGR